jgi:hypothetical protein
MHIIQDVFLIQLQNALLSEEWGLGDVIVRQSIRRGYDAVLIVWINIFSMVMDGSRQYVQTMQNYYLYRHSSDRRAFCNWRKNTSPTIDRITFCYFQNHHKSIFTYVHKLVESLGNPSIALSAIIPDLPLGVPCFLSHPLGYHSSISHHPFFSLCPLRLFHTFRYVCHFLPMYLFLLRSLLVIPSIHLSMPLCVHWILRNILEFSVQISHPYVITSSTHWLYAFFFKHSGMLDLKTMFILPKALHPSFILRFISPSSHSVIFTNCPRCK